MHLILYQKDFSLGDNVSFSDFLKAIEEKYYVNYGMIIEKTPTPKRYRFELVTHIPIMRGSWENMFVGRVLLSDGEILYSKKSRHFTIRAWAKGANLFYISSIVIIAILGFLSILYIMFIQRGRPTIDMFAGMLLMFVPLVPYLSVYRRDKDILNRIGSLGNPPETK